VSLKSHHCSGRIGLGRSKDADSSELTELTRFEDAELTELKLGEVLGIGRFATVVQVEASSTMAGGSCAAKIFHARDDTRADACELNDIMDSAAHEARLSLVSGSPHVIHMRGLFLASCNDHSESLTVAFGSHHFDSVAELILMDSCKSNLLLQLQACDRFSEESAVILMTQLLAALRHIHSLGVVHRDVKAENILIASDNRFLLGDFGMAVEVAPAKADSHWTTQAPAAEDSIMWRCGTPGYVAPEVIRGKGGSSKVDMFAAGVVLFLVRTGCLPFGNQPNWMARTVDQELDLDDPGELALSSMPCRKLMRRLLEKYPEERVSAEEALQFRWLRIFEKSPSRDEKCQAFKGEVRMTLWEQLNKNAAEPARTEPKPQVRVRTEPKPQHRTNSYSNRLASALRLPKLSRPKWMSPWSGSTSSPVSRFDEVMAAPRHATA
ncbi:unnamed protein product, partial [Polarella glacialis]